MLFRRRRPCHKGTAPGGSLQLEIDASNGSFGPEGLIVLASNVKDDQTSYKFTEQEPLGVVDVSRGPPKNAPESLLGQVMKSTLMNVPQTRGQVVASAKAEPIVLSRTWLTEAPVKKP